MAVFNQFVSMRFKKTRDLGFDGLGEQGSCTLPQHLGQRIAKLSRLSQLDDIILNHGVSLLRWRSGGLDTPMIRRLSPAPSPTSAHSSSTVRTEQSVVRIQLDKLLPRPHSIPSRRQASLECSAGHPQFYMAVAKQDRPSPAIRANALSL